MYANFTVRMLDVERKVKCGVCICVVLQSIVVNIWDSCRQQWCTVTVGDQATAEHHGTISYSLTESVPFSIIMYF